MFTVIDSLLDTLFIFSILFLICFGGNLSVIEKVLFNSKIMLNKVVLTSSSVSPSVQELANQASMTDYAKQIFYSTNPVIDTNETQFKKDCNVSSNVENSIELGCYISGINRIYILDINQSDLHGEMSVTAAHEMLHAAYYQMDESQKEDLGVLLEQNVNQLNNGRLDNELKIYQLSEPGQRDDELHSLLGTEYKNLSPALENYYRKYFKDRSVVVNNSNNFIRAFSTDNILGT